MEKPAKMRLGSIDDCIEALEFVSDNMSKGTLDAERAAAMIKIVNQRAYLVGKLPLEAARLLRTAREQGIAYPALPQGSPARNVLDLQEGMKQFRVTLKRVRKKVGAST